MNLNQFLKTKLEELANNDSLRVITSDLRKNSIILERNGNQVISFCSNDYLGLSFHQQVIEAATIASNKYGTGAGSSRLVSGSHILYDILEDKLAKIRNTEAACVFGNGYLTNIGVIPAIIDSYDLVIADKLCHACIFDGIKLAKANLQLFRHNNLEDLEKILRRKRNSYRNCLVITESVFSMDGDRADLKNINRLIKNYDSWLMVDDSHGFGVIEDQFEADIKMGTLSKSVGSYGGYICTSLQTVSYIKTSARSLIYSTALPPSILASSIAALNIIEIDKDLCKKPIEKANLFAKNLSLPPAQSAIIPLILGENNKAIKFSEALLEKGFLVTAIRPPTVPKDTARLRFTFSAEHNDYDIVRLAKAVKELNLLFQNIP